MSNDGNATVIGLAKKYQPQYAAILNGAFAHSMDFDDTCMVASLHPGAPVFAALLGQVDVQSSHGKEVSGASFITAACVGYEVACRIGKALGANAYIKGFHPTGTAGIFGAAAAAGRLASFDAVQMDALFGIVGSMASGSNQFMENGSWNKRLHPGYAAHNALLAVKFVQADVRASARALEGEAGFMMAYGVPSDNYGLLLEGLGELWVSSRTAIKPYPACRLTHGAIEALHKMRSDSPSSDVKIDLKVSNTAYRSVGRPFTNKLSPENVVDAQFSEFYQAAIAWLYGHNDWGTYKFLEDREVLSLCRRINVSPDPALSVLATVVNVNGQQMIIEHPLGEPENPVKKEHVISKFISLAGPIFGEAKATSIITEVQELKSQSNIAGFVESLGL